MMYKDFILKFYNFNVNLLLTSWRFFFFLCCDVKYKIQHESIDFAGNKKNYKTLTDEQIVTMKLVFLLDLWKKKNENKKAIIS